MYIFVNQDVHVSEGKRLRWTIAGARQNLPTVVRLAAREPQDIYRRDKLVARVVSGDADTTVSSRPSAADLLGQIQRICAEENYTLEIPPRTDRRNAYADKPAKRRKRRP